MIKKEYTKKTRNQIAKLFKDFNKIDPQSISDEEGNLDSEKLHALPVVKKVIAELKEANISRKELSEMGFVTASLILRYK